MSNDLLAQLRSLNDAAQSRNEYVRACYGYPGGKSRSISELLSHLPYRKVWVDAFAGSGAVTLARNESELEFFNDRCAGITSFFRAVRNPTTCKQLIERLEMTVCSREEFIWSRDTWQYDVMDDVERAARWYYAVQHSFGSKGWAFGRITSGKAQSMKLFNNLKLFWPICNRLRRVYIENLDWRTLLNDINNPKNGDGVVWYLDPPYWGTNSSFNHGFKESDHVEIAERCMHLGGFVALSGYDSPNHPYNKFPWTRKESWEIQLSMTGQAFTDTNNLAGYEDQIKRGKIKETLWIRDSASATSATLQA